MQRPPVRMLLPRDLVEMLPEPFATVAGPARPARLRLKGEEAILQNPEEGSAGLNWHRNRELGSSGREHGVYLHELLLASPGQQLPDAYGAGELRSCLGVSFHKESAGDPAGQSEPSPMPRPTPPCRGPG